MPIEAAILFVIELGATAVLFLFIPMVIALASFPRIWRDNRGTGTIYSGLIFWTLLLFGLLFATLAALIYVGFQGI